MSEHHARIHWQRNDAVFTDQRYSRAHRWHFDGGAEVAAAASPAAVSPRFTDVSAVDPEEAFVAAAEPFGFRPGAVFPAFGMAEVAIGGAFPPPMRGLVCDIVDREVLERDRVAKQVELVDPDDEALIARRLPVLGRPVPGLEFRIVEPETGEDLPERHVGELLIRGTSVTPGYYKRPDLTREAFDEEGFYRSGDAVKFADPADAAQGIVFDGRVAEDFKLSTGTWVNVGMLRVKLIAAADPLIQDAVISGHDRGQVGALVFLSAGTKDMSHAAVTARLSGALKKLALFTRSPEV